MFRENVSLVLFWNILGKFWVSQIKHTRNEHSRPMFIYNNTIVIDGSFPVPLFYCPWRNNVQSTRKYHSHGVIRYSRKIVIAWLVCAIICPYTLRAEKLVVCIITHLGVINTRFRILKVTMNHCNIWVAPAQIGVLLKGSQLDAICP